MTAVRSIPIGALAVLLSAVVPAHAQTFPIFAGDPVDAASGRAYAVLPGVPLILPQPDGRFRPPIVDTSVTGDVDIVVRAGSPMVGPTVPVPSPTPVVAIAGGSLVTAGTQVPFTVIATNGQGSPLPGSEMDGIPVLVFAFPDLDGDGVIGPTDGDAAGAADNGRELQETFPIGRQAALFQSGIARGSMAVWKGAPTSAGGLRVVLTAVAYVGPFAPGFFLGNVPDGPGVATLLPFFPRLDPKRVVESEGRGGPATPSTRLGVQLEPAFDPPVGDPVLGTPFALPTDGSSPTIDRADVASGQVSRVHFVASSSTAGFPVDAEVPIYRGAGGALYQALASATVADDGAGNGVRVRLVPVDLLDGITDPASGVAVTLIAGAGLAIGAPDRDGDPARETVVVDTAAGVEITLDDGGGVGDSGATAALTAMVGGFPVDVLPVTFAPGEPPSAAPAIRLARVDGYPAAIVVGCPARRTLTAVVADAQRDVSGVTASLTVNGVAKETVALEAGAGPAGETLPVGDVFRAGVQLAASTPGEIVIGFAARDAAGNVAVPVLVTLPVVATASPRISDVGVAPASWSARVRQTLTISARTADDCGVRRVLAEIDRGRGFRRLGRLSDKGRGADALRGDGVFTTLRKLRLRKPGTYRLRVVARGRLGGATTSDPVELVVVP